MNDITKNLIDTEILNNRKTLTDLGDRKPFEGFADNVKKYYGGTISLYRSFARTLDRIKSTKLPALRYAKDGDNHTFPGSPRFSVEFRKAYPALEQIANSPDKGCMLIEGLGNDRTLAFCNNPLCSFCPECAAHKQELRKALEGITAPSGEVADEMRHVHVGKLYNVLNSWSMHQFSRGTDASSFTNQAYENDSYKHKKLGAMFRGMFQNMLSGGNSDYVESGLTSGTPHNPEDMVK
jgi:hypothetical protein